MHYTIIIKEKAEVLCSLEHDNEMKNPKVRVYLKLYHNSEKQKIRRKVKKQVKQSGGKILIN